MPEASVFAKLRFAEPPRRAGEAVALLFEDNELGFAEHFSIILQFKFPWPG